MVENKSNIYEKLSAVTHELRGVLKGLNVGYGNNSYKAVCEHDILKAVKPFEKKHGIYSYPIDRTIVESERYETTNKNGTRLNLFCRVQTTYRFVNIENPTEFVDMVSFGDGLDNGDKGTGKAMTYSDKYALMKAYKIVTGDDPDQFINDDDLKPAQNDQEATQKSKPAPQKYNDYQQKIIAKMNELKAHNGDDKQKVFAKLGVNEQEFNHRFIKSDNTLLPLMESYYNA